MSYKINVSNNFYNVISGAHNDVAFLWSMSLWAPGYVYNPRKLGIVH